MNKVLVPAPGDVVVVSAGAGAVGSLVGQLAKLKGARVVGIAGSEAKCKYMKDEVRLPQSLSCNFIAAFRSLSCPTFQCGFDLAINYKTDDVNAAVSAFAPDGVHHYFDNVGGHVTDAILQVNACSIALHSPRHVLRRCVVMVNLTQLY